MQATIQPAIAELERAFTVLNSTLYADKLPKPVITIQAAGRRKAYGWFCSKAWSSETSPLPEINLCAEHLSRSVLCATETLVHEMVHLANWSQGVRDCNASQYHNKQFKTGCERIGLNCEKLGRFGWAKTSLSTVLCETIRDRVAPDGEAFALFRYGAGERPKAPTKMLKWSCGCTNIRAAVEVQAECYGCGERFHRA